MTKRKALGSGLESLLSSTQPSSSKESSKPPSVSANEIPVHKIVRNPNQPRKIFHQNEIDELAQSISENGQISPIMVRRKNDDFELIVGERRWRATQLLKKDKIKAVVIDADDRTSAILSIVENVQREDLNSMEEAESLERLIVKFNMSHEDVAKYISKSRTHITNLIRLNDLCDFVKEQLRKNKISMGHARAVLSLSENEQSKIIREVIAKKLSVRSVEKIVNSKSANSETRQKDPDTAILERQMTESLGAKTRIVHKGKGGTVTIKYSSMDELQAIIEKIRNS